MQAQPTPNIPVSEFYWTLLHKADKKFSKIRELPYYHRNRHEYDAYFYKVFKVYTQLWKFQQENRQKLVEAGLRRSEIGEIASRIAQLYLGQYMRTSEASYLSEAYIFYEAILSREYFKEGMFQDLGLASKQLRFISRFLMVCLLLNRREMVQQLLNQLRVLVDECKRTFQETDFKEWKLVIQEIVRFLKADTAFMNIRPLRYSLVLDCHPDSLPHVSASVAKRSLRLRDAILSSYHHNEVLATVCEELPPDGVILIYLSASGAGMYSDATSPSTLAYPSDRLNPSRGQSKGDGSSFQAGCLQFGTHGNGGMNSIYPSDLVPFTRRPLFLVIDSDNSEAFEAINGVQKGETPAMLLSSSSSYPFASIGSSRQSSGSLFTIFLTAPLQAFCLLIGISGSDIDMDTYNKAEKLLSSSFSDWGSTLVTSDTIDPVWAQILSDPFLRRLLLRFLFCRAALSLYAPTFNKKEFIPKCIPCLPASVLPTTAACQTVILQIVNVFGATGKFVFSEGLELPENRQGDSESMSS
ncbi:hypothetical protein PRUPE_2G099200 [Prunus persica]|uniref:Protein SCAI n=1 Tax=Prunus persica TaxID=3760 RepID=A0A251QDY0_PRUPE|nr:hypothetical protein PRUPE_2G099200 [Prunus persica]